MKRLVIIAEGDAEKGFVYSILRPYFISKGIYNSIQCYSLGGVSRYADVKKHIINTIYENDVVVSTMLDFYRLPSSFPQKSESEVLSTHLQQVDYLENRLLDDINRSQGHSFDNFIPYIQLHEFEALVFSSISGIDAFYEPSEYNRKEMLQVISTYPNPEDINDKPDTAPSVRLKRIIPGYNKYVNGIAILQQQGMPTLLDKCPHFRDWILKLEDALKQ